MSSLELLAAPAIWATRMQYPSHLGSCVTQLQTDQQSECGRMRMTRAGRQEWRQMMTMGMMRTRMMMVTRKTRMMMRRKRKRNRPQRGRRWGASACMWSLLVAVWMCDGDLHVSQDKASGSQQPAAKRRKTKGAGDGEEVCALLPACSLCAFSKPARSLRGSPSWESCAGCVAPACRMNPMWRL